MSFTCKHRFICCRDMIFFVSDVWWLWELVPSLLVTHCTSCITSGTTLGSPLHCLLWSISYIDSDPGKRHIGVAKNYYCRHSIWYRNSYIHKSPRLIVFRNSQSKNISLELKCAPESLDEESDAIYMYKHMREMYKRMKESDPDKIPSTFHWASWGVG